ncbi:MAG: hypothetical protein HQ564_00860 [Candidatus Saganbacteria bacterium]|nr:hypothetical protein [Candidatus Saganbacteria bacterium]
MSILPVKSIAQARVQHALGVMQRMAIMFKALNQGLNGNGLEVRSFIDSQLPLVLTLMANESTADNVVLLSRMIDLADQMPQGDVLKVDKSDPKNWINWFDLSKVKTETEEDVSLARGCNEPCHHCCKNVGKYGTDVDPLPYAIEKILREGINPFIAINGNDLLHWHDPFFNISVDSLFNYFIDEFVGNHRFILTRGWSEHDRHTQLAAEKIAEMSFNGVFLLSFHLALSSPNTLMAMYKNIEGDHAIPDKIKEAYGKRNANVIQTLGRALGKIRLLYNEHESMAYLKDATISAFQATMDNLDGPAEYDFNIPLEFGAYRFFLHKSKISSRGNGSPFFRKLEAARQGELLKIDLEQGNPSVGYPQISIGRNGRNKSAKVSVSSVDDSSVIVYPTENNEPSRMNELYPL